LLKVKRLAPYKGEHGDYPEEIILTVSEDSLPWFKEAIRRALNTWPDAHPELKELGDMLMHGKVLQDYYSYRTDKKVPVL
jgi:hypothetical protein